MKSWKRRPVEEANLFNPAFCAVLLSVFVDGYADGEQRGVPYALAFLVLPFLLDRPTREAIPATSRTSLLTWVQEHVGIATHFPEYAADLVPHTREALLFATTQKLLTLDGEQLIRPSPRALSVTRLAAESIEVAECLRKAKTLGKWLARAGTDHTIFATLGVRP